MIRDVSALTLVVLFGLAGCVWLGGPSEDPSDNDDPDPVAVPTVVGITPATSESDPVMFPGSESYQLELASDPGSATVYYRTIVAPPVWIVLTEATGEVVVNSGERTPTLVSNESDQAAVSFYASLNADRADDASGGSSVAEPFAVTFYITRAPVIPD